MGLRLSFIMGGFLAVSLGTVVFLLSLMAKVAFPTLLFRTFLSFFLFGILGAILGSVLEVLLMPAVDAQENQRLQEEISPEAEAEIEEELGDLLAGGPNPSQDPLMPGKSDGAMDFATRGPSMARGIPPAAS